MTPNGEHLPPPTKVKTNCVIFLSDLRNSSRQFKREPYPMTKIREILLNLEGFSIRYVTRLKYGLLSYSYYRAGYQPVYNYPTLKK